MKSVFKLMSNLIFIAFIAFCPQIALCQESLSMVLEAGEIIDEIQNQTVKAYTQKELDKILAIEDESSKVTAIDKFLRNLKAKKIKTSGSDNVSVGIDLEKEIEAINLLTTYSCLLNDLEGKGIAFVRKELIDNLNTGGLSKETISLLRQLIAVLDEADKTLKSITYIHEDNSQESAEMWGNNIGSSSVMSIAMGDPTPLIGGVVSGLQGQVKIDKEKNRRLDVFIQNHQSRITNFLFNVNLRRSELLETKDLDYKLFITKENYDAFKSALVMKNMNQKEAALLDCYSLCPNMRETLFYLTGIYDGNKNIDEAEKYCQRLIDSPSKILRNDGLLGITYNYISYHRIERQKYQEAVDFATKALKYQPNLASAYNNRCVALMCLNKPDLAFEDIGKAIKLNPSEGWYYWTTSRLYAKCRNDEENALSYLRIALQNGFCDFDSLRGFAPIQKALKSPRGKAILRPTLQATYVPGIFNDDIIVSNIGFYNLTNVQIALELIYPDAAKPDKNKTIKEAITVGAIDAEGNYNFKNILCMNQNFWCDIRVKMTCEQFPGEEFNYEYCYNYFSDRENHSVDTYFNRCAWDVFKNKKKDQYEKAYQMASDAVSFTYGQNPDILDTKARLAYELGKIEEAKNLESEAIRILKRDCPDNAESQKLIQEYGTILRNFK